MLDFIRPYTPDLVGLVPRLRPGRRELRRQRPLRAASSRCSTPSSSRTTPAGGLLTPQDPNDRLAGLQTGVVKRCPGAASQPAADGSAPFTRRRRWTATRGRCCPGHEARCSSSASCSWRRPCVAVLGTGAVGRATAAATRCARSSTTRSRSSRARTSASRASTSARSTKLEVTDGQPRRGGPEHHRPGLPGLPRGRDVHDPPAVADRREVRRVHADPAAPAGRAPAPRALRADPRRRAGRGPAPAAGRADVQAGRHRPHQQHHAPAPAPAPGDHPQRARRRPRRPRGGPQRDDPPREPGARRDERGPRDPRRAEPGARASSRTDSDAVLAPLAARPRAASRASSSRPTPSRRRPPSGARTSSATSSCCRASSRSCARR